MDVFQTVVEQRECEHGERQVEKYGLYPVIYILHSLSCAYYELTSDDSEPQTGHQIHRRRIWTVCPGSVTYGDGEFRVRITMVAFSNRTWWYYAYDVQNPAFKLRNVLSATVRKAQPGLLHS
jgi:hypothetical protein